jgi:putative CocE/NonD family hydrolase
MGDNRWRDENEWPLARTQYTDVYLHSGGKANSLNGDGSLSLIAPNAEEQQDAYVYDPQDPVPTRGGTTLGMALGVLDQNKVEVREDVLVYSGDLLNADMEVTGPISLTLYAASSAPDTDFTAKLVDVRPDGYAHNIAEGVIRARFRESLSNPTLITPGEVYGYTIDLWATSHVFKAGHRLRLEVSSSNFPRYDRNPNTGHDFGGDSELRAAQQTIYHDNSYPSHITLPVIPS